MLVDHRHSLPSHCLCVAELCWGIGNPYTPRIGSYKTREHIQKGGLSRTVFSEDGVDLARMEVQAHAFERREGAESLGEFLGLQGGVGGVQCGDYGRSLLGSALLLES